MIRKCLIDVLNQAAVAQNNFQAVSVPQDQRQCSKHFGPRINTISINQPAAACINLLILPQSPSHYLKNTNNSVWETASSTGAGKSINANAYHRCSMAITWASRTQLQNMENHALFPTSHPKFQDVKGKKKCLQTCCLCRLHWTTKIVLHCANHSSLLEHLVVQLGC